MACQFPYTRYGNLSPDSPITLCVASAERARYYDILYCSNLSALVPAHLPLRHEPRRVGRDYLVVLIAPIKPLVGFVRR